MRKIVIWMVLGSSLALAGCGQGGNELKTGSYQMEYDAEDGEEPIFLPVVELRENQEFFFGASLLSSYLYIGTYEIQDGELILKEEPEFGNWECRFRIEGEKLIFDEEHSSEVMTYEGEVPVEDGAVFVLEEEET